LGLNYLQRGDYKVALEKLEKALQQNPNLPSAHNTIALLYQRLGETDKAEKHFKEAIQRAPDYSEAENNYGAFLCQQGEYKESEKYFLMAIENPLYSNAAGALENAGLCANRIPDSASAEKHLRRALSINPRLYKSLFEMAKINYDNHQLVDAKAYLDRYRQVARWNPESLMLAIKIAHALGDQNAVSSYILHLKAHFPDSDEAQQAKQGQY
jgi:type IV pilus assembly protein PilF